MSNIKVKDMVSDDTNPVWNYLGVSHQHVGGLLSGNPDEFIWAATAHGTFTIKSAYSLASTHGVSRRSWLKLWHHSIISRSALFSWKLLHRAVQVDSRIMDYGIPLVSVRIKAPILVKWNPPTVNYSLHVDGASKGNPGICGGGGCIRDKLGNFIDGFAFFYGFGSSILAEARAIHDGLRLAIERHYHISVLYTDSTILLRAISSGRPPHWAMFVVSPPWLRALCWLIRLACLVFGISLWEFCAGHQQWVGVQCAGHQQWVGVQVCDVYYVLAAMTSTLELGGERCGRLVGEVWLAAQRLTLT
ncbi:hypothetical protein Taro_027441, partial [Colocasia esculenta]|nr:hypothetical protein [Colocasia esculenta]